MLKHFIFVTTFTYILFSCHYSFEIKVNPADAAVLANGENVGKDGIVVADNNLIEIYCQHYGYIEYKAKIQKPLPDPLGKKIIRINLNKEKYDIEINSQNGPSDVYLDNQKLGITPCKVNLEYGIYPLTLKCKGYADQKCRLEVKRNGNYTFRQFKADMPLTLVGVYPCGPLPKQVIFSPDDQYIYIPLLDGYGFDIFSMWNLNVDTLITPPDKTKQTGYPEGLFIKEKGVFWVSQMTTGKMYEYSVPGREFLRAIDTHGLWSKFMAWSSELQVVAVSNWSSNNVSIIDYASGKLKKQIKIGPAPRGLAFSQDGKFLYITTYDGGSFYKFSTADWSVLTSLHKENNAALRHVVLADNDRIAYVSDMHNYRIYEIDTDSFKTLNTFKVDYNPNTIELSPDERFLYVSSRGPNDSESYLKRSPRSGKVAVLDLVRKKPVVFFEGGNQPTGLDISHDGNYLCFSNFRDNNIEIYWLGDFNNEYRN